jgi:hypothetical protein
VDWDTELAKLITSGGVTGVTAPAQPPDGDEPIGGGIALADRPEQRPGNAGKAAELAALVAQAQAAIARGELPARPSQRALRDLLGVRMARAAQVQRALRQRGQQR